MWTDTRLCPVQDGHDADFVLLFISLLSIWINSAAAAPANSGTQRGLNPELGVIFYRLARLAALPLNAVFVFDGAGRPDRKRGKVVTKKSYLLTPFIKDLVTAFGFAHHTASVHAKSAGVY